MKIALMGSGALACPLLEGMLAAGRDELAAVVTRPDRAGGRGLQCRPCALKTLARDRGIPTFEPEDASEAGFVERMAALAPDVAVVACYGQFLRKGLLEVPKIATINVHPSLLPKYRGASPIQWALANGERETGVTVLHVTAKMDAGDLLQQRAHPIEDADTMETLEPKLAALGAELLLEALEGIREGRTRGIPQDEAQATFARKLEKEDGKVDWNLPAATIRNRWRGFTPWPGAYAALPGGGMLKIHGMRVEARAAEGGIEPGTVVEAKGDGPLVAAGEGCVRLTAVQPAGKKAMSGSAFLCGHRLEPGERFG